jgi:hypothetical protein
MKTLIWKKIIVTYLIAVIATVGFPGFAFSNPAGAGAKKSIVINTRDEKVAINKDLARINQQQAKVKLLEKQCRDEKAAGVKSSATYTEWMKAKADFAIKAQREELRASQKKLDADLAEGKASAVLYAQQVVEAKHDLKLSEAALDRQLQSRDSDLLVINREIRDNKGESAFVLTVDDKYTKTETLALKERK